MHFNTLTLLSCCHSRWGAIGQSSVRGKRSYLPADGSDRGPSTSRVERVPKITRYERALVTATCMISGCSIRCSDHDCADLYESMPDRAAEARCWAHPAWALEDYGAT